MATVVQRRAELVRARAVYEAASKRTELEYGETGAVRAMTRATFDHAFSGYMDAVAVAPMMVLKDGDLDMRVLVDIDRDLPTALLSATRRNAHSIG